MTIPVRPSGFVGLEADRNTGILTPTDMKLFLLGLKIWLPGDYGAIT
jgi:hypothetical protein